MTKKADTQGDDYKQRAANPHVLQTRASKTRKIGAVYQILKAPNGVLRAYYLIILGVFFLSACSNKKERYSKLDLSEVPVIEIDTHRYEAALFSLTPQNFEQELDEMAGEFRVFLGDNYKTPQSAVQLIEFINNPIHQEAWTACQKKYKNIDWLSQELAEGFRRYRYFYPETGNIALYTYISGYNWEEPTYILQDTVVVGLDNFLGADFEIYNHLQIPQYISVRMDSAYLVSNIFQALITEVFWGYDQPKTLIDNMISCGKTLYFLNILLPKTPKESKIGYTKAQLQFCEDNEDLIWQFFIENNLLFSADYTHVRSFIQEAPYTNGFPPESPGRIGQWIGWQIVTAYMNKNEDISLQNLMLEKDYKKILQQSGYKPKK